MPGIRLARVRIGRHGPEPDEKGHRMDLIRQRFVLTGALKGQTVKLRDFRFDHGTCVLEATAQDLEKLAVFLERNWQALPESDPRAQEVLHGLGQDLPDPSELGSETEDLPGAIQLEQSGPAESAAADGSPTARPAPRPQGSVSTGNGLRPDGPPLNQRLVDAIHKLDANTPEHWTAQGKPALEAVERIYGSAAITRADIDAATPNYDRKMARRRQRTR